MQDLQKPTPVVLYKGMNKDLDPQMLQEGQYSHAINSQINSHLGNFSFIQNEPANKECLILPPNLQYIGAIAIKDSKFVVFSTDNTNSEIGIFDTLTCTYTTLVNDPCLSFSTSSLIKGVSKENTDCTQSVYWADNLNPNRFLNINAIPYTYTTLDDECKTKVYSTNLDCSALLIDQIITVPCLSISLSKSGGNLFNGAYQVGMAYSINGQKVTDIYSKTNAQQIFTHENLGQAVDVSINNQDMDFSEFKLYIIATIAQQTTMYEAGTYSISTSNVTISNLANLLQVPLSEAYLQKVVYSTSRDVITVNNQLLWMGASTKQELNYQPLANLIRIRWVAYAVPEDYYKNGGTKVSYMRDETYPFGIQWLYNTGDYSPVYPLMGRTAKPSDRVLVSNRDAYELFAKNCDPFAPVERWKAYNTASGSITGLPEQDCKEFVVGTGEMAYWESTELYPDNEELYGVHRCTPIRHPKFPDECIVPRKVNDNDKYIILLGVEFDGIRHPVDNNGNPLTNIVGYRIVRGDRTTDKRIQAKGLFFNTGMYDLPVSKSVKVPALYPNYPFNDLRLDPFLSKKEVKGGTQEKNFTPMGEYKHDFFTFHSPSLSFDHPSLGTEVKIEAENFGQSFTTFEDVFGHPSHKIITDVAFIAAALLGIGEAYLGTRRKECKSLVVENFNSGVIGVSTSASNPAIAAAYAAYAVAIEAAELLPGAAGDAAKEVARQTFITAVNAALLVPGLGGKFSYSEEYCADALGQIPLILRALNDIYLFSFYFQQGVQTALNAINNFAAFEQYALQANSYCYYNKYSCPREGSSRRYLDGASYLFPTMQEFEGYRVNNFRRESSVILKMNAPLDPPVNQDTSRETLSSKGICDSRQYDAQASSYYGSIRQPLPAQYGQIDSIKWLDTGLCEPIKQVLKVYSSPEVFGGDTYLNRMTYKRHMHYFNQTEFQENDGHEFDYRKYYNLPYARYWMDTTPYDLSELINLTDPKLPNDKHNFDCKKGKKTTKLKSPFIIRDQHVYLSNNSVIDFWVESEYNLDYRDWEEQLFYRHFDRDTYSDLSTLLRSDHLEYDNRFLYDKSLSKQLLENTLFTQSVYYDLAKATTCYTSYPNRVYWSLPYFKGQTKDSWGFYLPNNYYDFPASAGQLVTGKALSLTNILFLFEDSGPYLHQAQDTLQTDGGVKVTIGDGGLFAVAPQAVITTDVKYGNCQSRFALTNTQFGLFYPSQRQGRVFLFQGGVPQDISRNGLNWWFKENMPYKLLEDFPTFTHIDNPVIGVGYSSAFDNTDEVYYLSKKDYKVKADFKASIRWDGTNFKYRRPNGSEETIRLYNTTYFEDASWTVSYNPKLQSWISFHDWHPNAILQEEKRFCSILTPITAPSTVWRHNVRCDRYSTFYNIQFPWEVEYVVNNGPNTSVLHNLEYSLECYRYFNDCYDQHHLLDYNFNEAIVYNTEQISGLLQLNIAGKNRLSQNLFYPVINPGSISIEFHKEEQKYRFNQFWDITNNRAEFNTNYIQTFITSSDGYHYNINPLYVNYNKPPFERKKLRHNWHKVYLRRTNTDEDPQPKMILKITNNKEVISPR